MWIAAPKSASSQHSPAAHACARKNRSQQHGPTSIPFTQPVPQHPWCGDARASSGYTASVQPAAREAGAR